MTSDAWETLRDSIAAQGLLVPIVTWRGQVVDGRHRLRACEETGREPSFVALPEDWTEEAVSLHCLGLETRRGLSPGQLAAITAGHVTRFAPAAAEAQRVHGGTAPGRKSKHLPPPGGKCSRTAAAKAAALTGASTRSTERALRIGRVAPEALARVTAGTLNLDQAERIAKAPEAARAAMLTQLDTGDRTEDEGDSWGTPPDWIELARRVMGGIDVDPATNEAAQRIVGAAVYYTRETDGLKHEWPGRVWLNPPYSQPLVSHFAERLLSQLASGATKEAMVLVNNTTDTRTGQALLAACSAVLFPARRVAFCLPGTDQSIAGSRQGQMLLYFGPRSKEFAVACAGRGWVGVSP